MIHAPLEFNISATYLIYHGNNIGYHYIRTEYYIRISRCYGIS